MTDFAAKTPATPTVPTVTRFWLPLLLLAVSAAALLFPAGAFTVDEAIYIEMARAMAEQGSFAIAGNGGVDGAPALLRRFTHDVGGLAMPQYPSGYALFAAPFYAAFGLNGLILMNALSAGLAIWLTLRIGQLLYRDGAVAVMAAALLGGATFISTYAFGIWPHMLSLALLLGGIERILTGLGRERAGWVAAGGLLMALALTVRVDAILAILAVFIWLRLFAAPSRRSVAAIFVAGLIPGLLLASVINQAKFGAFLPVAYGPLGEDRHAEPYLPYLGAAALVLVCVSAIDVSRPWAQGLITRARRPRVSLVLGAAALIAIAAIAPLRDWVVNTGILLFDLQQIDPTRSKDTMSYDAAGLMTFWGLHKTALFQSVPFAMLAVVSLFQLWQGRHVRAHALGLGVFAAYALFYGLNQWHGGYSYTMRYFIPALPALALLSAAGLRELAGEAFAFSRRNRLALGIGAALGGALMALAPRLPGQTALLDYYVPLAVAAALGLILVTWRVRPRDTRVPALATAAAAIGLSGVLALQDLSQLAGKMAGQAPIAARYDAALPADALLVTYAEPWMVRASLNGTHVVNPRGKVELEAAGRAFLAGGRCVFAHGEMARDALDPQQRLAWKSFEQGPEDTLMGPLFVTAAQPGTCS